MKPGDYQLFINHVGYKTDTVNLSIPSTFTGNFISVNSSLVPNKVFKGDFLAIKNLLFDYDSYKLSDNSISTLEKLKYILLNYPDLKIEVAGYTDSKGSTEYNMILADKRAQSIIDYLSASGISASRFVKKAFGSTNFVALNTNPDGTDNPEGRKYNRRVTFGIINPHTGVAIRMETYTPAHLRQPNSVKYNIILLKTEKELTPGYFSKIASDEYHLIRTIKTDSGLLYSIGVFNNKNDALQYLGYLNEKGFKEAYIVTQYDINSQSPDLFRTGGNTGKATGKNSYTIQLSASKQQLNMSQFKKIKGVREVSSSDGFFRYICGEYDTYAKAKAALAPIQEAGFKEAFIKEMDLLDN